MLNPNYALGGARSSELRALVPRKLSGRSRESLLQSGKAYFDKVNLEVAKD
jgi:hypothetical protein